MPLEKAWPAEHGTIVHEALDQLAKTGQIDFPTVRKKTQEKAAECGLDIINQRDWAAIVEGQLRGFLIEVWPHLMAEYEILDSERWVVLDFGNGYRFRCRQDLLLRNRFDGHVCYVDYKNTSSTKAQWIKSWSKSVQLHSSMYAIEKAQGIKVERALVIGLFKGYKDEKKNNQRSIFSYAWVNREFQMSPQYSYEYQRSRGWELFSVADEFEDLDGWVGRMPHEILTDQYPQTAPIMYREDIAAEWFAQQLIREEEVATATQLLREAQSVEEINNVLRKYYKQNFSHCDPPYGFSCDYQPYCWIPHVAADPLSSGYFERYKSDLDAE